MLRHRTAVRSRESHAGNSTGVDNPGDNQELGAYIAYMVTLEVVRQGAGQTVDVECAGLDRADAARRARWQAARDAGVDAAHVHVVTSRAV